MRSPEPETGLPFMIALCVAACFLVVLANRGCLPGCPKAKAAPLPKPEHRLLVMPDVREVAKAIKCLAPRQAEHALVYSGHAIAAVESKEWPDGAPASSYLPLLLATVTQQSRWKADAVSQWNRDEHGERIRVDPRVAWRKGDVRLDYGLMQIRWSHVGRWAPGTTLDDLKDPTRNLALGAEWLRRRAVSCAEWLTTPKLPNCRRGADCKSVTCRCLATWRALGALGFAGSTSTLLSDFAPETWRCIGKDDEHVD